MQRPLVGGGEGALPPVPTGDAGCSGSVRVVAWSEQPRGEAPPSGSKHRRFLHIPGRWPAGAQGPWWIICRWDAPGPASRAGEGPREMRALWESRAQPLRPCGPAIGARVALFGSNAGPWCSAPRSPLKSASGSAVPQACRPELLPSKHARGWEPLWGHDGCQTAADTGED